MVRLLEHSEAAAILRRHGYLMSADASSPLLAAAVGDMQARFLVPVTGLLDSVASRLLLDRYCGVPDHLGAEDAVCAWPREQARAGLKWTHSDQLSGVPTMTTQDYKDVTAYALAHISTICGARFEYTANAKTADVVMGTHRESGGGVLAWSELPCGSPRQLEQSYDDAERWHWKSVAVPSGYIGLIHVIRHEWGHALGLPHGGDWLMRPTYDPRAHEYGSWETTQLVNRYGPPQLPPKPEPPPPVPPPPPGGSRRLIVEGDFSFRVEAA